MQSTNEELNTVNDELRGRNAELSRLNSDLSNLLASVQIAIVFIGSNLRIRRFTPMAESVLNLIPSDVGRPFTDSATTIERDVRDRAGRTYALRIRPDKNLDDQADGAVLSLFDVEAAVRAKEKMREALDLAEAVFATVREPMAVLDAELRVERVNPAFCRAFGIDPVRAIGAPVGALAGARWMRPELQHRLEQVFSGDRPFDDLSIEIEGVGPATAMVLNARRIERAGGKPGLLLLAGNLIPKAGTGERAGTA